MQRRTVDRLTEMHQALLMRTTMLSEAERLARHPEPLAEKKRLRR